MTRYFVRAAALIVPAALAALAGCAAQPQAARATVALSQEDVPIPSNPGTAPPQTLPVRTVALSPGQSLAVRYDYGPLPTQWTQTADGDPRVLGQATATTHRCSRATVGCSETATITYTARSAGATTVRWSYILRGGCNNTARPCPIAVQAIDVTVHP